MQDPVNRLLKLKKSHMRLKFSEIGDEIVTMEGKIGHFAHRFTHSFVELCCARRLGELDFTLYLQKYLLRVFLTYCWSVSKGCYLECSVAVWRQTYTLFARCTDCPSCQA